MKSPLLHPKSLLIVALLFAVSLNACGSKAPEAPASGPATMTATSPQAVSSSFLGVPLNSHFETIQGEAGRTLFPKAASPKKIPLNGARHEVVYFSDSEEVRASAAGWGISAAGQLDRYSHHATHRAYQLEYALVLDDSTKMRKAPPGAFYYASRIYFGHSYEYVMHGDGRAISAHIGAKFLVLNAEAGASAGTTSLELSFVGRGLEPKSKSAIFLESNDELEEKYAASGPPVPILVEYRRILGARPPIQPITWPKEVKLELILTGIRIIEDGTAGQTPWTVRLRCESNGRALPLAQPDFFSDTVDSGAFRPLHVKETLRMRDGDELACSTGGTFTAFWSGTKPLQGGTFHVQVKLQGDGSFADVEDQLVVTGGKAKYQIDYRLHLVE